MTMPMSDAREEYKIKEARKEKIKNIVYPIVFGLTILTVIGFIMWIFGAFGNSPLNTPQPINEPAFIEETSIQLKDGRTIICVYHNGLKEFGLSCDWENPE